MMRREQAFPSSYLSQEDVRAGPVRRIIDDVRIETVGQGERETEKPVMHFREKDTKPFVVNLTNWTTIEASYGPDSDGWRGRPLELYLDPGVKFGRETVGGVRVRIPSGAAPLALADAVAEALKLGRTRDDFLAALKARGLKGYSATKDAATARTILADWAGAEPAFEDTIPF